MGETSTKKGFFKSVRKEFKKIIWPDKKSAAKQTIAVLIITVILGVIIKLLDTLIQSGIDVIC